MKTGRLIIVVAALVSGGAADCNPPSRAAGLARADAIRMLRSPVICEGGPSDGYVCVDNKGGMVTCPAKLDDPCKLVAGRPEAPTP